MLSNILLAYGFESTVPATPFGSGLINNTWLIENGKRFILQRINTAVFSAPSAITENIDAIGHYLKANAPSYMFTHPVKTLTGDTLLHDPREGYFRLFPFVEGSYTVDVVQNAAEAFEAAKQFGRFTMMLRDFNTSQLHLTLPRFHDMELRYNQFTDLLPKASKTRKEKASQLSHFLLNQYPIVEKYKEIISHPGFKTRVTHHDTKISNVLFDKEHKGLCVIDLDTVMPGYFISDVGDMMRTYLCPVSEEEEDVTKIELRPDYFAAIVEGYLQEMQDELTPMEKEHFVYAGKFMIYMQALRFLADYLNEDRYYGQKYEGHNLVRATNQATLLKKMLEQESDLQQQARALCQASFA